MMRPSIHTLAQPGEHACMPVALVADELGCDWTSGCPATPIRAQYKLPSSILPCPMDLGKFAHHTRVPALLQQ